MKLYTIFHCNLNYSSIEEEQRPEVIEKCYWPLLNMVRELGIPTGIEASGYTVEVLQKLDRDWVTELRVLMDAGIVEFVGSGYQQIVGPLVPARVVVENLKAGHEVCKQFLGEFEYRPKLALLGEQAYWPGCVELYKRAGYEGIITHARRHLGLAPAYPRIARGVGEECLPCIFTDDDANRVAREWAWGDPTIDRERGGAWYTWVRRHSVFPLYGGDAEVIGFRPRGIGTVDGNEWARLQDMIMEYKKDMVLPSDVLSMATKETCIESDDTPTPMKSKYTLDRWRVGGRDNISINGRCLRIYNAMMEQETHGSLFTFGPFVGHRDNPALSLPEEWRELCYLYGSDFRTYITEKRWEKYLTRLSEMEGMWLR